MRRQSNGTNTGNGEDMDNKIKKMILAIAILALSFSAAACGTETDENPEPSTENPETGEPQESPEPERVDGSLGEILDEIYSTADISESFKEYIDSGLVTTEIEQEKSEYYFGVDDLEFEEAIASEPMMTSSAYSLCLVRINDETGAEEIMETIRNNVNPQKWICVGVDRENVIVDNIGDLVILIMSDNEPGALHDAFLNLT